MKKKILIFGSGSIGTHHANAAVSLNYNVFITDKEENQLINMRENIYPSRYKKWNEQIKCLPYKSVFNLRDTFDLIIIGVPPNNHLKLLKTCIKNLKFKKVLVEKPLCVFSDDYNFLLKKDLKNKVFCGYNHSISKSYEFFLKNLKKLVKEKNYKLTVDIHWKESFDLVLKAHPWIKSISQSYLSNFKKGGGVSHEYSHAIHLFLILKEILFKNKKIKFEKKMKFLKKKRIHYDEFIYFSYFNKFIRLRLFANSKNNPPIKKIVVKNDSIHLLEWTRKLENGKELVKTYLKPYQEKNFKITRRDDFINELKLLLDKDIVKTKYLNLAYAIQVNMLLKSIFKSYV